MTTHRLAVAAQQRFTKLLDDADNATRLLDGEEPVFTKLDVHSRAETARIAAEQGITQP